MNNSPAVKDFQDVLKAAAVQFLQRHHAEHLTYDYHLRERASLFLTSGFNVVDHIASRIVDLAVSDITAICDRQQIDTAGSTSTHAVIVDPETGTAWAIPVSLIFERIVGSIDCTRYRVTNT